MNGSATAVNNVLYGAGVYFTSQFCKAQQYSKVRGEHGVESAIISDVKMRGTHSQSKFRECLKGVPAFKTVIEIKESGCRVPCPLRSEGPMACLCLASSWEIHSWQSVQ